MVFFVTSKYYGRIMVCRNLNSHLIEGFYLEDYDLRRRQTVKGQILIFILLVLLGLVLISVFLSTVSVRVRAAPIVKEAVWTVDRSVVSTARVGEKVEARMVVEAVEEYVGSIVVRIKKDVRLWWDSDYHVQTIPVNLAGSEQKEIEIAFTPDQASTGSLRGYFIEIEFQATRTTWTMENSYPPRLIVTE